MSCIAVTRSRGALSRGATVSFILTAGALLCCYEFWGRGVDTTSFTSNLRQQRPPPSEDPLTFQEAAAAAASTFPLQVRLGHRLWTLSGTLSGTQRPSSTTGASTHAQCLANLSVPAELITHLRGTPLRGVLNDSAVSLWRSLVAAPHQRSPYRWPAMPPELDEASCVEVGTGYREGGFASKECAERRAAMSGAPLIDLRLHDRWQPPFDQPTGIVIVDCAWVSSLAYGYQSYFVASGTSVLSGVPRSFPLHLDAIVTPMDEAASIGISYNLFYPGHFPNENLPRLLYLDALVPPGVPLLHPGGGASRLISDWLAVLRETGAFANRPFVFIKSERQAFRVHKLYLFVPHLGDIAEQQPFHSSRFFTSYAALSAMGERLRTWAERELGSLRDPMRIVVLQRSAARGISNHVELMAAVAARWPNVPLLSFEPLTTPGFDLRASLLALANATLVVAPHGAGNNNIMAMRHGTAMVEVGPPDAAFLSDYSGLARTLGMHYYWMLAESNATSRVMTVDVAGVVGLMERAVVAAGIV